MDEINIKAKIKELLQQFDTYSISLLDLPVIKSNPNIRRSNRKLLAICFLCIAIVLAIYWRTYLTSKTCMLEIPSEVSKLFRPPEMDCAFCENVVEVKRVSNISPQEFENQFAYNSIPVIVTDATRNWTALNEFDFWYFKRIYEAAIDTSLKPTNCQFFPYKSGFKTFEEALSMPDDRVQYEKGTDPWYFGWSNCNHEVAEILRQHYGRPYFLPKNAENIGIDWIFMGGPGLGAHMHVDNVRLPSWQAQIKGSKLWILAPPPECYYKCSFIRAKINTGDIIVLDTNRWYHKTSVLPGELSITIGTEYD